MDIFQIPTVTVHHGSRVEIRFTFLGACWKEERFHRNRLYEDRGLLSLADVLATIGGRHMLQDEARQIDPKGAAALTAEDLLLKA